MYVATERFSKEGPRFDFFDMDFSRLPFENGHPNSSEEIRKPDSFEEMKRLSSILSEGIPHVRVDFYDIEGVPVFGEMTFYHMAGMTASIPKNGI